MNSWKKRTNNTLKIFFLKKQKPPAISVEVSIDMQGGFSEIFYFFVGWEERRDGQEKKKSIYIFILFYFYPHPPSQEVAQVSPELLLT